MNIRREPPESREAKLVESDMSNTERVISSVSVTAPDRALRLRAITKLGGRCAAKTCRWLNENGTLGCKDERALQFHHRDGGGSAKRREGKESLRQIYFKVLRGSLGYELLCGCCHEIEKKVERRSQGARQHKQPARVRRSLQLDGEPVRRVKEKPDMEYIRAEESFLNAMKKEGRPVP